LGEIELAKYPQIFVAEKFQSFLKELARVGKPPYVDQAFIKKLGFKSSYDEAFLGAIKFLGLWRISVGGRLLKSGPRCGLILKELSLTAFGLGMMICLISILMRICATKRH
jgi:hypothetical protein